MIRIKLSSKLEPSYDIPNLIGEGSIEMTPLLSGSQSTPTLTKISIMFDQWIIPNLIHIIIDQWIIPNHIPHHKRSLIIITCTLVISDITADRRLGNVIQQTVSSTHFSLRFLTAGSRDFRKDMHSPLIGGRACGGALYSCNCLFTHLHLYHWGTHLMKMGTFDRRDGVLSLGKQLVGRHYRNRQQSGSKWKY